MVLKTFNFRYNQWSRNRCGCWVNGRNYKGKRNYLFSNKQREASHNVLSSFRYSGNKALISKYLIELDELLSSHPNVYFGFEASVAGGIPIIQSIQQNFKGDKINSVSNWHKIDKWNYKRKH